MIKLTKKYVKNQIENIKGYKLLSTEYKNAHTKLKIQCDKNHIYDVTWNNWKKGCRCPICNGNKNYKFKEVKEQIESVKGYKLLSTEYKNNYSKLNILCPNKNIWKSTYKKWINGKRCNCLKCKNGSHRYTNIELKDILNKSGYILTDKYKQDGKLNIKCDKGHLSTMTLGNFLKGHRCKYCAWIKKRSWNTKSNWDLYKYECRKLQYKNYKLYEKYINPKKLKIGKFDFHIDHIYSISDGFKNKIPVYIISSVSNLQMLYYTNNLSKGKSSSITKHQLINNYFENMIWH